MPRRATHPSPRPRAIFEALLTALREAGACPADPERARAVVTLTALEAGILELSAERDAGGAARRLAAALSVPPDARAAVPIGVGALARGLVARWLAEGRPPDGAWAVIDHGRAVERLGALHEAAKALRVAPDPRGHGRLVLVEDGARRSLGAHYTPQALASPLVQATLAPLLSALGPHPSARALLRLRLVDPAMGAGALLLEAARQLTSAVALAWARGRARDDASTAALERAARRLVVTRCLHGVDVDPVAVELGACVLASYAGLEVGAEDALAARLVVGDALVGVGPGDQAALAGARTRAERLERAEGIVSAAWGAAAPPGAFHWPLVHPRVFARGGFDAVLGNPPYVSAALRAQTGAPSRGAASYFKRRYRAASGSYDLSALFLERGLELLRPGGVLGLLLPNKLLSAGYAEGARRLLLERADIAALLDASSGGAFDAGVYPVTLVAVVHPPGEAAADASRLAPAPARVVPARGPERRVEARAFRGAPGLRFGFAIGPAPELLETCLSVTRPLGELAEVHGAATVAEAYRLAPHLVEAGSEALPDGHGRFVVSGNIRPGATTWASSPVRYLGRLWTRPLVPLDALSPPRRLQAVAPKLVVSGMARQPTAFLDAAGEWVPGKTTVVVRAPRPGLHLEVVLALLSSRLGALLHASMFAGLSLSGGYLRFGPPELRAFPVPSAALADGAALADRARAGGLDEDTVCALYGVDPALVARLAGPASPRAGASSGNRGPRPRASSNR